MSLRKSEYPVLDVILNRHSSRAMSGESISHTELMTLFEAARWAPSSYNNQPWRFIYATKNDEKWNTFLNFMVEFNQSWCKNASVIMVLISRKYFEYNNRYSRTHSFDAGSAWENLAIQGLSMHLVVHALEGFDYERARKELDIPEEYQVECMVIVGKPAPKDVLPEKLQEREQISGRKPIKDLIFKDSFNSDNT